MHARAHTKRGRERERGRERGRERAGEGKSGGEGEGEGQSVTGAVCEMRATQQVFTLLFLRTRVVFVLAPLVSWCCTFDGDALMLVLASTRCRLLAARLLAWAENPLRFIASCDWRATRR